MGALKGSTAVLGGEKQQGTYLMLLLNPSMVGMWVCWKGFLVVVCELALLLAVCTQIAAPPPLPPAPGERGHWQMLLQPIGWGTAGSLRLLLCPSALLIPRHPFLLGRFACGLLGVSGCPPLFV